MLPRARRAGSRRLGPRLGAAARVCAGAARSCAPAAPARRPSASAAGGSAARRHRARDHAVDEMGRGALPPPRGARGAKAAAFARQSDQHFLVAVAAAHAREAVGQHSALEVALELGEHETGEAAAVGPLRDLGEPALPVPAHGLVQQRRLDAPRLKRATSLSCHSSHSAASSAGERSSVRAACAQRPRSRQARIVPSRLAHAPVP